MSMTRVVLRPSAEYATDRSPGAGVVERLHHRAHDLCFIANSVRTEVTTEIVS
jgi:organic hydroperoxide reductase OsmC/OhrA